MTVNTTVNMTIELSVLGIGLLGPGLNDWSSGQALLADSRQWLSATTVVPPPARLPATERRRAGIGVKASVVVADRRWRSRVWTHPPWPPSSPVQRPTPTTAT